MTESLLAVPAAAPEETGPPLDRPDDFMEIVSHEIRLLWSHAPQVFLTISKGYRSTRGMTIEPSNIAILFCWRSSIVLHDNMICFACLHY